MDEGRSLCETMTRSAVMIRTMKSSETAAINETQTPLNDENEEDEGERGDL